MSAQNYEKSGVSIAAGEALVDKIKQINPQIGGFAGLYPLDEDRFLVGCTDGVGTKLKLSIELERYEALGQDLVAMSVNDLIVCGARPLFFLDYYATGKLDVNVAHRVIQGIAQACRESSCVLLGGETAEMPGFYAPNTFDLAGFAVGEVRKEHLIDGSTIQAGDVIVGLKSSGFHANGYSLVRHILSEKGVSLAEPFGSGTTLGDLLTEPTKLYVADILKLQKQVRIKGMSHITGGGLTNIGRVLPAGRVYRIDHSAIPTPDVMKHVQALGQISQDEAFTVWNMGMGFVVIVAASEVDKVLSALPQQAFVAGHIV